MNKQEAIKKAKQMAEIFPFEWGIIKRGEEYYEVSEHWFKQHGEKPIFITKVQEKIKFKQYKWYKMPIVWLNRFLLKCLKK